MSPAVPTVYNPLVLPATDRHPALPVDRTLVMGVVNVTPDSFSDGGAWFEPADGIRHGLELVADGADIVDVGGESTRPGAGRVSEDEELRRVLPVVDALAAAGAVVSVDTMRASVAAACLERGAAIVNDVSGGLADPAMAGVVADAGVPFVLMHWRGPSDAMTARDHYDDVLADVVAELSARLDVLLAAGVDRSRIVLDPGLGFAKNGESNWPLLAGLDRLSSLGLPVLVGASRKRFLGSLLADPDGTPAPATARDGATAAVTAIAAAAGVWCVRVHDVRSSADAVRVAARWRRAAREQETRERATRRGAEPAGTAPSACAEGYAAPSASVGSGPAPSASVGAGPAPSVSASAGGVQPGPAPTGIALTEITLTGITATGYHGVFDHERRDGQPFGADLRLTVAAPRHDDLAETADYGAIARTVHDILAGDPVDLVETLADRIATAVLAVPVVRDVTVTVHKPRAPIPVPFGDVSVTVTRSSAPGGTDLRSSAASGPAPRSSAPSGTEEHR